MPKLARLFHNADEVVDAWRDALKHRDVKGALAIWLDDDSITCVLPEGQHLSGHAEIRAGLERLLAKQALFLEPIACISHSVLGQPCMTPLKQFICAIIKLKRNFFSISPWCYCKIVKAGALLTCMQVTRLKRPSTHRLLHTDYINCQC